MSQISGSNFKKRRTMYCPGKRMSHIGTSDRISDLPEHVTLDILSRLPLKDAARASVLSKTMNDVSNLYPILYFDHNLFALNLLVSSGVSGREPDCHEIRDRFLDVVDSKLSRAKQLNLPIRKLALSLAIKNSDSFNQVDRLMDLVRQCCVEDLCLSVQTDQFRWIFGVESDFCYEFPYHALGLKGLRSLFLHGCKFNRLLSVDELIKNNVVPSFSLKKLCLSHVFLDDDVLGNLAMCSPGIEILELVDCIFDMEILELSKFSKLKKAFLGELQEIDFVEIEQTNLECFKCDTAGSVCQVTPTACSSIRELTFLSCTLNQPNLFKDLTSSFPLLEEAKIDVHDIDRIKASNNHLRKLVFYSVGDIRVEEVHVDCPNMTWFECHVSALRELYIDCPKLKHFYYYGTAVPSLNFVTSSTDIMEAKCELNLNCLFDTLWFVNLNRLLEQIAGNATHLHLQFSSSMATFNLEELRAIQVSRPFNVNLEVLILYDDMQNIRDLVDGLMWSIRPKTLRVYWKFYDFVKYLCEKLADVSRENSNSNSLCNMGWWDHIIDFEVESELNFEDVKGNMATFLELCRTTNKAPTFKFRW